MTHVNAVLTERLQKSKKSSKMATMAKQSAQGSLTPFSGVFSVTELNETEKSYLEAILYKYSSKHHRLPEDLHALMAITSEVKAINIQSALLHGERISNVQTLLKTYREGAFTAWLMAVYGNRQTPYNFLHYYEFYKAMPNTLHQQLNAMPRQAVYTLASREGAIGKKQKIVENYKGETKSEVLRLIREAFPLAIEDKRKEDVGQGMIKSLARLITLIKRPQSRITKAQKKYILEQLEQLCTIVKEH